MIQILKMAIVVVLGIFLLAGYFGVLVGICAWFEEKERLPESRFLKRERRRKKK